MKGDKFHYHQTIAQKEATRPGLTPWRDYPNVDHEAGKWAAYEDQHPRKPEPEPPAHKDLPPCRGIRKAGMIPGTDCRRFVTSTPPGGYTQLAQGPAHITTAPGVLPTCMGADSDVPETNCTNRKAPICKADGSNGIPNVSCTPALPECNGTNGHSGVDCVAPALPACGVDFGGRAGVDCAPVHSQPQNWHYLQ